MFEPEPPVFDHPLLAFDNVIVSPHNAGITTDDVDLVLFHQANLRILEAAVGDLGLSRERVVVNLDRYGNTSAGSTPIALDEAFHAGLIQRGDTLLLSGFGAGLTWGTCLLRW